MRKLLFSLLLASAFASAYQLQGKVIKVSDGDTIHLLTADGKHKIRLSGVDAPEKAQPYGNKSKQMLAGLIAGKVITADCEGKDRYKRDICTLYLNGIDINATMVRNGGAWVYRKYYRGTEYYALEQKARDEKLGLWHTSEYQAIPPWEWRKKRKK